MQETPPANTSPQGRGRGGRRRGRGHRRARGGGRGGNHQNTIRATDTPGTSPDTTEASAPQTQTTRNSESGPDPQSWRARGRNRRGGRSPRGGISEQRGGRSVGGRTFGSQLTAPPSDLSATAPDFVPGAPSSHNHEISDRRQREQPVVPEIVRPPAEKSTAEDLPTRIHEDISNHIYECVICTNEVLRSSSVWSCNICWGVMHLTCVKRWHTKQMDINKEKQDQDTPSPDWRCPCCNTTLTDEPGVYHCWCGKDINPKFIAGLPPHSCGQTCSKTRPNCPHPCMLQCHAGPCPPCELQGPTQECFCGRNSMTRRCVETSYGKGWSCGEVCGELMACGEHQCLRHCHSDICGDCRASVTTRCYCGKVEKNMPCVSRDEAIDSFYHGQQVDSPLEVGFFEGWFDCERDCGRLFDCGKHKCKKKCHPQDEEPARCPLSPDVMLSCPCGKTLLSEIGHGHRTACTDPIPGCNNTCEKELSCGHQCQISCHNGECPPCSRLVDVMCRCGRPFSQELCLDVGPEPPICDRTCQVQMNCGRHACPVKCCRGEKKATARLVARRRNKTQQNTEEFEAEHICIRVCNKPLKCGTHACQQICHKGACSSCLMAIFDEISCNCGRTTLHPPLPCGTKPPNCSYPCTRTPACGHPRVEHNCHLQDSDCPKCPFLREKQCMCGKQKVRNQPCWLEDVRCGLVCGKKLKCGIHLCQKTCHRDGECEGAETDGPNCTQKCGKSRSLCGHACQERCHTSTLCKEDRPCQTKTLITCPCQAIKQEVRCGACNAKPEPHRGEMLKCNDECLRLQRNQRLASALAIDSTSHMDDHVPYSDETLAGYRESPAFSQMYEREFRVFASDETERRLRFKPMSSHQRKFIHALAADFGLDSESQDLEPQRHVCIFKTPRFVSAPRKTVGQCVRIRAVQQAAAAKLAATTTPTTQDPYNALLLTGLRFGLIIDEVETAISKHTAPYSNMVFTTTYMTTDEIIIRVTPKPTASMPATAVVIDAALLRLRPIAGRDILRAGLSTGVVLCHADAALKITRREDNNAEGGDGGWSAVVGRAAQRKNGADGRGGSGAKVEGSGRRLIGLKKKKVEVEDDWLAAAEKLEGEEGGEGKEEGKEEGEVEGDGEAKEEGKEDGEVKEEDRAEGEGVEAKGEAEVEA